MKQSTHQTHQTARDPRNIRLAGFRLSPAITIIVLFGVISMLGDVLYETARSANSQYLSLLGVSAAQVGLIFGLGEFLGYVLRLLAGILSDRSGRHWPFIFAGYGMLLAVPLLGAFLNVNILFLLIIAERVGKALRSPAKDTLLSGVAENQVGVGFAFGLQEALDQIGAFAGPLVFTAVFYFAGKSGLAQYQTGYRLLAIPFMVLMVVLWLVWRKTEREGLIPKANANGYRTEHLRPIFWVYTAFTFFCALGFVNFSVIGYHLKATGLLSDGQITLLYAAAMGVDALVALAAGRAYDRLKIRTGRRSGGLLVLVAVPVLSLAIPALALGGSPSFAVAGMLVFGMVLGIHETIMRSAIADLTPFHKRGTGYGVFNTSYGLALLCGAWLMGMFYDADRIDLILILTVIAETAAVLLFLQMRRMVRAIARDGERQKGGTDES